MKEEEREYNNLLHFSRKSPTPSGNRLTAILKWKKTKSIPGFEPSLPRQNAVALPLVPEPLPIQDQFCIHTDGVCFIERVDKDQLRPSFTIKTICPGSSLCRLWQAVGIDVRESNPLLPIILPTTTTTTPSQTSGRSPHFSCVLGPILQSLLRGKTCSS